MLLGVDTGGTFTDFVLIGDSQLRLHKVLSTPEDPSAAIEQGIAELGLSRHVAAGRITIIHGSTVATNAALEGMKRYWRMRYRILLMEIWSR